MDKQSRTYQAYVQILKEELIPAMGCTEPIAIAYAAAKARDVLGGMPGQTRDRREQQHLSRMSRASSCPTPMA